MDLAEADEIVEGLVNPAKARPVLPNLAERIDLASAPGQRAADLMPLAHERRKRLDAHRPGLDVEDRDRLASEVEFV